MKLIMKGNGYSRFFNYSRRYLSFTLELLRHRLMFIERWLLYTWFWDLSEPITVTVWGVPHQVVILACKTGLTAYETECFWSHGSDLRITEVVNATKKMKHTVYMNHTTGVCTLQFTPDERDFGEWICEFLVNNAQIQAEFGTASILLLNNSPDQQLGWLVGAITSTVLFLLIIIVVVVVCKTRMCNGKIPAFLETLPPERKRSTNESSSSNGIAGGERYAHALPKIDLSYTNPNFLAAPENINSVLPNRSPHLFERIGRKQMLTKNYENVGET